MPSSPSLTVTDFESRQVYRSPERPGYTSWVSFFPGEAGQWYLTCEEVTRPDPPLPRCTAVQWQAMGLPIGYDKSQYLMEAVILRSDDDLRTWRVVSRQPYRHHHTVGQFGTARTADGRFLRFLWASYSLDEEVAPNQILQVSEDDGATWQTMPPLHPDRCCSYPHRLRTLRDQTLVLGVPLAPRWGTPERPLRTCRDLSVPREMQMCLYFSFDQGRTWQGPLPVFPGENVSETDFVELPSGDLLLVNNSIFPHPGRQRVYREGRTFTPGPLEQALGSTGLGEENQVPETVCLTADGLLVGCLRPGRYSWSGDLGRTWWPLAGIPDIGPEVYQPWIHALPDGRLACAGHYGRDAPISGPDRDDQYLSLHLFRLQAGPRTRPVRLTLEREVDPLARRWRNAYTATLTCGGEPLPDREVELWYVERDRPGYDSHGTQSLEVRMAAGGVRLRSRTDAAGRARFDLAPLDAVIDPHRSIQLIARFNTDRADPAYLPSQTCQFEVYCLATQDPALK
ncbi:MAG: sialidase family protein [Candidatus Latescibacterota bacterium]|jgi:hypothetical protein